MHTHPGSDWWRPVDRALAHASTPKQAHASTPEQAFYAIVVVRLRILLCKLEKDLVHGLIEVVAQEVAPEPEERVHLLRLADACAYAHAASSTGCCALLSQDAHGASKTGCLFQSPSLRHAAQCA